MVPLPLGWGEHNTFYARTQVRDTLYGRHHERLRSNVVRMTIPDWATVGMRCSASQQAGYMKENCGSYELLSAEAEQAEEWRTSRCILGGIERMHRRTLPRIGSAIAFEVNSVTMLAKLTLQRIITNIASTKVTHLLSSSELHVSTLYPNMKSLSLKAAMYVHHQIQDLDLATRLTTAATTDTSSPRPTKYTFA